MSTQPSRPPQVETKWSFLAPAEQPDEIGRLADYRILKQLGQGGMGIVFQAEDQRLRRLVALKVMRPDCAAADQARARFLREAYAAAALKNDHIVTIYHVGEDRDVPFLAMEFLTGKSLEEWLRPDRRASMPETLTIGRQIAEGLAAAHAAGMIHRDIKPANIWLEAPRGRVKILDFGLARYLTGELTNLTQSGAVLGTPAFMAPEQARGETVDHRCDLFSFGCVLYRMVTGRLPFQGSTLYAVLHAIASETPSAARVVNPAVPPRLDALIAALLEKSPDRRPPSAEAVLAELQAIGKELKATTSSHSGSISTSMTGNARSRSRAAAPPVVKDRRRVRVAVLAGVAIAAIATTVLALRPWQQKPEPVAVANAEPLPPADEPNPEFGMMPPATVAGPSIVGTWDGTFRNGSMSVFVIGSDGTVVGDKGFTGRWSQTGRQVIFIGKGGKANDAVFKSEGELDATGESMDLKMEIGGGINCVRRAETAPSVVGSWETIFRNGNKANFVIRSDGTVTGDNGFQGTWEQTRRKVAVTGSIVAIGKPPWTVEGEIDSAGNTMTLTTADGKSDIYTRRR